MIRERPEWEGDGGDDMQLDSDKPLEYEDLPAVQSKLRFVCNYYMLTYISMCFKASRHGV